MADVTLKQQIFESINKANRILIPLSGNPTGDSLASALALFEFLKKLNKDPQLVCLSAPPERYRFLPGASELKSALEVSRGFVISVRTENAPLDELSYHLDEATGQVNIYLKPLGGHYEPADVSFRSDKFPYDLIVVLGLPSLDLLGKLYDGNTDLFFETPVINIDHHVNNEHYGEINLVDITATATAEILMELLESFESGLIDAGIATNLLAGILVETKSFQHIKTTPKAFLRASSLISLGANQQEIIKHLYKTKSVNLLKLWGRALARIKEVPELSLTYTLIKTEDLAKSGSSDILAVMEELASSLTESKTVALLAEIEPGRIQGYFFMHPSLPVLDAASALSAETVGNFYAFALPGRTLERAEEELLSLMQKLKPQLGPAM
jgi:nanoRNase/pAp phosphatase (c-di-AMP/oligoRNAs hydrolase)